jgi:3'-5' exoribonuclease
MDLVKIADMKKGMSITGFYLVKSATIKNSSSGNSQYGDYTIADETGEINGKIWDVAEPESCPTAGSIIKLQGLVNEYQGKLQLRIDKFRDATSADPIDPAALVPAAPISGDDLYLAVDAYADKISHEKLRQLVKLGLEEHMESLLIWPAAVKPPFHPLGLALPHAHDAARSGSHDESLRFPDSGPALRGRDTA